MPRIMPEVRYFSMPSSDVGAEVLRNRALNCWPWVLSLVQSPETVIHSPAESPSMADDGDEVAVTARLHPDDAEAVLGVLVGDPLNQPSEHLPIGWLWLRPHDAHRTGLVAKALARRSRADVA